MAEAFAHVSSISGDFRGGARLGTYLGSRSKRCGHGPRPRALIDGRVCGSCRRHRAYVICTSSPTLHRPLRRLQFCRGQLASTASIVALFWDPRTWIMLYAGLFNPCSRVASSAPPVGCHAFPRCYPSVFRRPRRVVFSLHQDVCRLVVRRENMLIIRNKTQIIWPDGTCRVHSGQSSSEGLVPFVHGNIVASLVLSCPSSSPHDALYDLRSHPHPLCSKIGPSLRLSDPLP